MGEATCTFSRCLKQPLIRTKVRFFSNRLTIFHAETYSHRDNNHRLPLFAFDRRNTCSLAAVLGKFSSKSVLLKLPCTQRGVAGFDGLNNGIESVQLAYALTLLCSK